MTTTLARKARQAFLFVLFTPLLLGIVVVLELSAYQTSVDWVEHTHVVLSTMDTLLLTVTRAESAQRGFLLTRNDSYFNWFLKAHSDATRQVAHLKALTVDNPSQQKTIEELRKAVEERLQALERLLQVSRSGTFPTSNVGPFLRDGTGKMEQIWAIVHTINEREDKLLSNRTQAQRNTEIGVGVSFAVCILANLGALFWAYRLIERYGLARDLAAEQILRLNAELEQRVADRTAELQTANAQLTRSNDDLTNFAYIASHDLQEPLRTIGSYVGLLSLRYQGKLDEQADRYIKFVVDGAKRMQNLVQDLLIYSRIGTESLRLGPVNMESVLRSVRDNLDLLIREQEAVITSGPLPSLTGDEGKLTQLLTNLVNNAIKFRKSDEVPRLTIEASQAGAEWLFCVTDNGIGFDQQYAERIFAIFQRLHGVGVYPGTGMGLAICKRIVEQHGGRIWAVSVSGEGTSFSFTLPVDIRSNGLVEAGTSHDDKARNEVVVNG